MVLEIVELKIFDVILVGVKNDFKKFLTDERVRFILKKFFASITPIVCVRKFRSYIFNV